MFTEAQRTKLMVYTANRDAAIERFNEFVDYLKVEHNMPNAQQIKGDFTGFEEVISPEPVTPEPQPVDENGNPIPVPETPEVPEVEPEGEPQV